MHRGRNETLIVGEELWARNVARQTLRSILYAIAHVNVDRVRRSTLIFDFSTFSHSALDP